MNSVIKAKVFRYDPDKDRQPYFDEFKIKSNEEMSVLVLLKHIQEEIDPTLSYRSYCCGLQMCRSCLMKIDHKKQFACLTLVKPGQEVIVEPAAFPDLHIKDLVTKLDNTRGK